MALPPIDLSLVGHVACARGTLVLPMLAEAHKAVFQIPAFPETLRERADHRPVRTAWLWDGKEHV